MIKAARRWLLAGMEIFMKLKPVLHRMLSMCPDAWYIFLRSIQLCCVLLFCAFMLLLQWNERMLEHYELYMTAMSIAEVTQALLLIAVLLSVCIEDIQS